MLGGSSAADLNAQRRERRRRHLQSLQSHDGNSLTVLQSYLHRVRDLDTLGQPRGMMPVLTPSQSYRMGNARVQLSEITRASLAVIDDYAQRHNTDLIAELGRLAGEPLPEATAEKLTKMVERARRAATRAEEAIAQALAQLDHPSSGQELRRNGQPAGDAGAGANAAADAAAQGGSDGQGQAPSDDAGPSQPDAVAATAAAQQPGEQDAPSDAVMETSEADDVVGDPPPAAPAQGVDGTSATAAATGTQDAAAGGANAGAMQSTHDSRRGSAGSRRTSRSGRETQRRRVRQPYEYLPLALIAYNLLIVEAQSAMQRYNEGMQAAMSSMHRTFASDLAGEGPNVFANTQVRFWFVLQYSVQIQMSQLHWCVYSFQGWRFALRCWNWSCVCVKVDVSHESCMQTHLESFGTMAHRLSGLVTEIAHVAGIFRATLANDNRDFIGTLAPLVFQPDREALRATRLREATERLDQIQDRQNTAGEQLQQHQEQLRQAEARLRQAEQAVDAAAAGAQAGAAAGTEDAEAAGGNADGAHAAPVPATENTEAAPAAAAADASATPGDGAAGAGPTATEAPGQATTAGAETSGGAAAAFGGGEADGEPISSALRSLVALDPDMTPLLTGRMGPPFGMGMPGMGMGGPGMQTVTLAGPGLGGQGGERSGGSLQQALGVPVGEQQVRFRRFAFVLPLSVCVLCTDTGSMASVVRS